VQVKGIITRKRRDDRRFTMEFEVKADKVEKSIIKYCRRRVVMARLLVNHGKAGNVALTLILPHNTRANPA
jgi:hypothetical protein